MSNTNIEDYSDVDSVDSVYFEENNFYEMDGNSITSKNIRYTIITFTRAERKSRTKLVFHNGYLDRRVYIIAYLNNKEYKIVYYMKAKIPAFEISHKYKFEILSNNFNVLNKFFIERDESCYNECVKLLESLYIDKGYPGPWYNDY